MLNTRRIILNSALNALNGLVSATVTLALPPLLLRLIGRDEFSIWVLVLQFGSYIGYLGFGLQTAVSRFVAIEDGSVQAEHSANEILSTSILVLSAIGVLGTITIYISTLFIPGVTSIVPQGMRGEFILILPWALFCCAVMLPLSAINGYFFGKKLNGEVVRNNFFLKASMMIFLPIAAAMSGTLQALTTAYCICHLIAIAHYSRIIITRRGGAEVAWKYVSGNAAESLAKFCAPFMVWTCSMFLVQGLAIILVARFEYSRVGEYAIIIGFIGVLTGLHNAIFSNLLPEFASSLGQESDTAQAKSILSASVFSSLVLILAACTIIHLAPFALPIWLNSSAPTASFEILALLLFGTALRLTATPFAMHLLATNQQRTGIRIALAEGIVNALSSVVLAYHFGATGVALGLVLGASVGISVQVFYGIGVDKNRILGNSKYLIPVIIKPAMCALPTMAFIYVQAVHGKVPITANALLLISTLVLISIFGVDRDLRAKIVGVFSSLIRRLKK